MKLRNLGFSTYIGLGIIIFVTLVGALGYTYVMSNKAEVASESKVDNQHPGTIAAETMTAPEVEQTDDLETAIDSLEKASVDELSDQDLKALEAELDSL